MGRHAGRLAKRIAIAVAGGALLVGGAIMLVTPGPGLIVIFAGLGVLATEFAWAASARDRVKDRAETERERLSQKRDQRRAARGASRSG
jgi:uncharacterized protein (TIGR02611 family)